MMMQYNEEDITSFENSFREKVLENETIEDTSRGLSHKYRSLLENIIEDDSKSRLIISINDIRDQMDNSEMGTLTNHPRIAMLGMQRAAISYAKSIIEDDNINKEPTSVDNLQIGFADSLGDHAVSPRGLSTLLLKKLVVVEGIITKCSGVKPKLVKTVHYCEKDAEIGENPYTTRTYRDHLSLDIGITSEDGRASMPSGENIPKEKDDGTPLETEFGLSTFKDTQTVTLQEMPERAKVGQLPRSVDVILEHDLVDKVKPGDRVQCVGIYRPLPNDGTSSIFPAKLLCNNISIIGEDVGGIHISGDDIKNIRTLSDRTDILDIAARSLCPSIYGHDYIKQALVLQLLGGCERNLENKTHLRGDINIMIIGDPSTAKSQLLRSVMDIAPLAISTTGRGSSGVGLTAAVGTDSESGERILEAGATVLADRGVVCVDEFDKMSENDRVAIHEVMEQQTVTIAKAGIHATLNARCSVLAAANPVYGQYDRSRRPQENIGLPDSLLSRFDLLFVVLDQLDPSMDRMLSEHVIRSHQYRRPGTTMEPESLDQISTLNLDDDRGTSRASNRTAQVWRPGRRHSTSIISSSSSTNSHDNDIFTGEFMRKYIHYVKKKCNPELTEEAMTLISEHYTSIRSRQTNKTLPVTARSLETLIRISSAHAKLRLSKLVEKVDVEIAKSLVNFVLYSDSPDAHNHNNEDSHTDNEDGPGGSSSSSRGQGNPLRRSREESSSSSNSSSSSPNSGRTSRASNGSSPDEHENSSTGSSPAAHLQDLNLDNNNSNIATTIANSLNGENEESDSPLRSRRRSGSIGYDANANDTSDSGNIHDVDGYDNVFGLGGSSSPGGLLDRYTQSQSQTMSQTSIDEYASVEITEEMEDQVNNAIHTLIQTGDGDGSGQYTVPQIHNLLPTDGGVMPVPVLRRVLKQQEDKNKLAFVDDNIMPLV